MAIVYGSRLHEFVMMLSNRAKIRLDQYQDQDRQDRLEPSYEYRYSSSHASKEFSKNTDVCLIFSASKTKSSL